MDGERDGEKRVEVWLGAVGGGCGESELEWEVGRAGGGEGEAFEG